MSKTIAVCGTFDTKGEELSYLKDEICALGLDVVTVDMGMGTRPTEYSTTYPAAVVAEAAENNLDEIRKSKDTAESHMTMSDGAGTIVEKLVSEKKVDGVICMAGGRGTFMACRVLRRLPAGLPKVLISTVATCEGIQHVFAGINDTMVINPLVDIAGLNPILRAVIKEGAACVCGMVHAGCALESSSDAVRVGITMWGVTTPCVDQVRKVLEKNGYEVLVFHANGMGGLTMDKLVEQGFIHVVADLTLSEITQPVCKGKLDNANAVNRMMSACKAGVPQVVSFGGIDMVEHSAGEDPGVCEGRKKYHHNADFMFYRSNAEENERCAKFVADKLNASNGKVTVVLPLRGTSAVDKEGEVLYERETNQALVEAVHKYMKAEIDIVEVDSHINEASFANTVAGLIMQYAKDIKK